MYRAPELEGPKSLYPIWGHTDFRVVPPSSLQLTPWPNFWSTLWPTHKDGLLRSTLAPSACQLPHKTFLLEEPPAMPSADLAIQLDRQGQGIWLPNPENESLLKLIYRGATSLHWCKGLGQEKSNP